MIKSSSIFRNEYKEYLKGKLNLSKYNYKSIMVKKLNFRHDTIQKFYLNTKKFKNFELHSHNMNHP